MKLYQYIDDILIRRESPEKVGEVVTPVWLALHKAEVDIPPEKYQGPSTQEKFLGIWIAGNAVIPPDTLRKIKQLQMPNLRKNDNN